jgi:hypothetical protein
MSDIMFLLTIDTPDCGVPKREGEWPERIVAGGCAPACCELYSANYRYGHRRCPSREPALAVNWTAFWTGENCRPRMNMSNIVVKKSNELIDPQAQMLVGFLKDMGLPFDNVIADAAERKIIGDNLDGLIRDLPVEVKKDAHYLSKFVIGAGFGLFDYSLNAVWNEVVINLRRKAAIYGLDIFFDSAVGGSKAREYYKTEEDLASIKDSVLLDTCRKLELISDSTYKKLKHVLDMRNDIGISHPNNYSINAFELLGWLKTCISEVLHDNPTEAALQVQAFVKNLRSKTDILDRATQQNITKNFSELPSHLCGSLLRTMFGIYVASDTEPAVRKNISLVAPALWATCRDEAKFKLESLIDSFV